MIAPQVAPHKFEIGQIVDHVRYGYRGIIVARDPRCRAPERWYEKNQTQPDQLQPWYHVLVDGSDLTTYAAETSLTSSEDNTPIRHPLVHQFFEFLDGVHVRNETAWPSWQ